MHWILIVFIMTILEMISFFFLKSYSLDNKFSNYIIGIFSFVILLTLLVSIFNQQYIGIINITWNIFSTISAFILGYYFFNEKITTKQGFGLILSLLGLYFLV